LSEALQVDEVLPQVPLRHRLNTPIGTCATISGGRWLMFPVRGEPAHQRWACTPARAGNISENRRGFRAELVALKPRLR
jgi:hypothetical protein